MRNRERGATLIVVLMILLLIMVIGTLAIRQSLSSLKIVSNHQINTLLLQNSDAALMYFQNPNNVSKFAAANGIVGYYRNETNRDRELVFCFAGTDPFNLNNAAWLDDSLKAQPIATGGGPCKDSDVSGGRSQVITQVHIKKVASDTSQPFSDLSRGTDITTAKTESSMRLQVYVISIMKGLVTDTAKLFDKDKGCLYKSVVASTGTQSITECLTNQNILFNSQIAQYRFLSDFEPPK